MPYRLEDIRNGTVEFPATLEVYGEVLLRGVRKYVKELQFSRVLGVPTKSRDYAFYRIHGTAEPIPDEHAWDLLKAPPLIILYELPGIELREIVTYEPRINSAASRLIPPMNKKSGLEFILRDKLHHVVNR